MARPVKVRVMNSWMRAEQRQRRHARHQHPQRQVDQPNMDARPDIGGFDVAVVDAEHQDQRHLGDKQQAEEESKAAQRFLPAFFERQIVDLINRCAERKEHRQHDDADDDWIDAKIDVDEIGDVRAEDDETRMRDIDDVEHAERDRHAGGDSGVKAAEQEPRDNGVDQ